MSNEADRLWRGRAVRAERRAENLETALEALRVVHGREVPKSTRGLVVELAALLRELDDAGDPIAGRDYTRNRSGTRGSEGTPGAATKYARQIKARTARRVYGAIRDARAQLDGEWEPPPRCRKCRRTLRHTARLCDRCGTRIDSKGQTPSAPETPTPATERRTRRAPSATIPR